MLIVTISAFASPLCILFVPLLNKKLYDRVMTFLVALGIGAVSGSVIFIMLPHASSYFKFHYYLTSNLLEFSEFKI